MVAFLRSLPRMRPFLLLFMHAETSGRDPGDENDHVDLLATWEVVGSSRWYLEKYSREICAMMSGMSQEAHEPESMCLIGADGETLRAEVAAPSEPELVGPIIWRLIETKRRTAIDASPSPSSPPLTPPPTLSEPAKDVTPDTAPVTEKGSKGPQATSDGRRKVEERRRRLKFQLP